MATQLTSRTLGAQYARAAPDLLSWAQERQFFQLAVRTCTDSNASIEAAVANNVERTVQSLLDAAVACAAMGLSMNPIAKLVYFIPRRERERNDELDASEADYKAKVPWIVTATPSYMGLAYIATHYAGADDVACEVVFKADKFDLKGPFHLPDHRPTIDNEQRTYALAIGAYCGIRWPGGRERSEYIDAPTIARIRAMSKRPGSIMWDEKKLWTEGWKKAACRRACKLGIQGNPRMMAAEVAMRDAEGVLLDAADGDAVPRGTSPNGEGAAPEGSKRTNGAKPRGMAGVRAGLDAAEAQNAGLQADEQSVSVTPAANVGPQATRSADPPREPHPAGDLFGAQGARGSLGGPISRAEVKAHIEGTFPPEEQKGIPEGSIEWWCAKIKAAVNRGELNRVRDEALAAKVDQGTDAEAYRIAFRARSTALRELELRK